MVKCCIIIKGLINDNITLNQKIMFINSSTYLLICVIPDVIILKRSYHNLVPLPEAYLQYLKGFVWVKKMAFNIVSLRIQSKSNQLFPSGSRHIWTV